ncbi:SDR family NAD(P)-dependent oxidoreductase [Sphingobium chlorophenolicum]|uniref:3-alpha-(Or 20-beta)-hydroxysteroid dehydrogenase n=1 Tax=Sphingobium chlorophenolicum TaxID=46429 RepID=A0A081RC01_SPHCR|nr:glucose 1-dehydrogenase [Sphingobium chlorophenolicum]KEQ52724.1 3-alpha-(Or 20-beta)-hydroxysteroid dehydrogenase [Sphingobium chlorophenolicum]
MGRLANKVAIVTGGASGIGGATVRRFVGEGARVLIADIDDVRGAALAEELGPDALFQHLDVSKEGDWTAAIDAAMRAFGRIEILVNDAGYYRATPLQDATVEEFQRHVDVNQLGVFLGMQAVVAPMRAAGGGAIVNISSTGGMRGGPSLFHYRATKWAVRGMTRSAAHDLASLNIRVNTVLPGPIETPMMKAGNSQDRIEAMKGRTLLQRLGQPSELAAAVLFLASDEASYITGIDLPVDGGTMA